MFVPGLLCLLPFPPRPGPARGRGFRALVLREKSDSMTMSGRVIFVVIRNSRRSAMRGRIQKQPGPTCLSTSRTCRVAHSSLVSLRQVEAPALADRGLWISIRVWCTAQLKDRSRPLKSRPFETCVPTCSSCLEDRACVDPRPDSSCLAPRKRVRRQVLPSD